MAWLQKKGFYLKNFSRKLYQDASHDFLLLNRCEGVRVYLDGNGMYHLLQVMEVFKYVCKRKLIVDYATFVHGIVITL